MDIPYLEHAGVKGMKWGVRKETRDSGIPRKTDRRAKKDADEFAKAKMFYGEGAGTRRKLIKTKVESTSNRDPAYKQAFERHLNNQNMAKRASQATTLRRRTDTKNAIKKTSKGFVHILKGNAQYASVAATVIAGGAVYAHKTELTGLF